MTRALLIASGIASALGAGCADAPPDSSSSQRFAIFGGEISGEEDDAVVRVVSRQPAPYGDLSCSGTLIAPNVVLTALHCVSVFDVLGRFSCRVDGSLAPPDLGGGAIGETIEPSHIEVSFGLGLPPRADALGLRVFGTGSLEVCIDDLAFVVLDRALPLRGLPVRRERPVVAGELMTLIGFGWTDLPDAVRVRRRGVPAIAVGPDDTSGGIGRAPPRAFIVGDGPCDGDSGAPAVSEESGAVTGVFSLNFGGNCVETGTQHSFTKLAPFANLLDRAFDFAGQQPMNEPASTGTEPSSHSGCTLTRAAASEAKGAWAWAALLPLAVARRRGRVARLRRSAAA